MQIKFKMFPCLYILLCADMHIVLPNASSFGGFSCDGTQWLFVLHLWWWEETTHQSPLFFVIRILWSLWLFIYISRNTKILKDIAVNSVQPSLIQWIYVSTGHVWSKEPKTVMKNALGKLSTTGWCAPIRDGHLCWLAWGRQCDACCLIAVPCANVSSGNLEAFHPSRLRGNAVTVSSERRQAIKRKPVKQVEVRSQDAPNHSSFPVAALPLGSDESE